MSDLAQRIETKSALTAEATPAAIVEDEETAAMRRTRRLLLVGIPLFWSSWYIYNSYISVYARALGASLGFVGITVAAYGLTQFALRIPIGIASDRLGIRKPFVLVGAFVGGVLGCTVMLLAATPWAIFAGRALAGIGAACWVPLSLLLVASYPRSQVAKATAIVSVLSGLGITLSSGIGGQLAQIAGVRMPFGVGIVLGVLAIVLLSQIKEPPAEARKALSVKSLLGVGKVPTVLVVSILALLSHYNVWATTQGFVPIYAANLNISKAQLGILISVWQACNTLISFASAPTNARLGTRWTVALGFGVATVGTVLIPLMHGFLPLIAVMVLHGIGQGIVFPVLMAGAITAVPISRRGAAMGFFQAIYAIGMVAGPFVSGLYADRVGLTSTFYMLSALSLISAVVAVMILPHRVRQAEELDLSG